MHTNRNPTQHIGAIFFKPAIVRQLSASRALVKFPYMKVNGFSGGLTTVVANVNNIWTLVGNQRIYEVFVNGFVNKRISLGTQANRYETGINLVVRNRPGIYANDATISSVTVYGPGLPDFVDMNNPGNGITLNKKTGCDFMSLNTGTCGTLFRFRSTKFDGSEFVPQQNTEYYADP